jgi:hypothetical protein
VCKIKVATDKNGRATKAGCVRGENYAVSSGTPPLLRNNYTTPTRILPGQHCSFLFSFTFVLNAYAFIISFVVSVLTTMMTAVGGIVYMFDKSATKPMAVNPEQSKDQPKAAP